MSLNMNQEKRLCETTTDDVHPHAHQGEQIHVRGEHLLQVKNLSVGFRMYDSTEPFFKAKQKLVQVIENLSISVHKGEIIGIVGASGSGKTLLADAVMGLFEPNSLVQGDISFEGIQVSAQDLQALRGHGISLVPQSINHLDPLMKVGRQIIGAHEGQERARRIERLCKLFERYDLAEEVCDYYPHELSGGMARRVLLCCALIDEPKLIIADEPTPGLDLDLALAAVADLRDFAREGGGVLFITHDIELALRVSDRIAVFKDGTVLEEVPVSYFERPELLQDPFSRALWHALPEHDFNGSQVV